MYRTNKGLKLVVASQLTSNDIAHFRIDQQPVFSEVTEHVTLFSMTDTQQDRSSHGGHM